MDCSAGAALGQQLAKNAFHMQGGSVVGSTTNLEHDALMNETMMMASTEATAHGAGGDWAQHFAVHQQQQQHMQQMAMRRQQNDAFMIYQQRGMEEAFRTSSAMQQQQQQQTVGGPVMIQPHLMTPMICGAGIGTGFAMGAPTMMMPYAPMRLTGDTAMATTAVTSSVQQQQQQQQQQAEESGWADKLRDAEWAQDYSNVQVFTVDGQPEQTIEEHAKNSQFYQFMDKIRNKELLIDEETGQVVEGPGPDVDVPEDMEYLRELTTEGDISMPPGVFEHMMQNSDVRQDQDSHLIDGDDVMMSDNMFDPSGEIEDWVKEYNEIQEQMQRVENSTDYPFEPNNPYMYHDNPMEEGLAMLQMGNLAEAALAFEAVCQKESEHQEGWRLLGTTQAENEKDRLAIIALNRARMLNPKDCIVHAALAVSHTNEHNMRAALQSLRAWLLSNPQYEQLGSVNLQESEGMDNIDEVEEDYFYAAPDEYRECRTLLNAAVEMNPNDPQLHSSLGVLHNISHNFDAAAVNFRRAVELCPEDANMWNKLGATLANGNKPQEALEAYNRALDINPGYVRVMYNMAVSYSNMAQYPLAAKQVTRAIAVQAGCTNPQGEASRMATRVLWDTLRMSLNLMDRKDLLELSWEQDVTPFLKEFGLEEMMF